MKTAKLKNLILSMAAGLTALSCSGTRDPHFAILGKSQGLLSPPVNNKVDILWVIDNSGTMGPKQTNLANSINSFMSSFVTKNFDYQIAVVTTDVRTTAAGGQDACIVGNPLIITPSTPNPVTALASNANVGFFGDAAAKGIDAIRFALDAPRSTGCNTGFLRDGAYLAVINFSDADDNDSVTTTTGLVSYLDTLKPPSTTPGGVTVRNYSVSAMVAPDATTADCQNLGPFTENGLKFMALANATGGVIADICQPDFSAGLLSVATRILEQTTAIRLNQVPQSGSISVFQNELQVPENSTNGWTFDSTTNSIIFHGTWIPTSANILLTVHYKPEDIVR